MNENLAKYKDIIMSHTIPDLVMYDWDKFAFGFSNDSILDIPINKLKIKYNDMENVNGFDMRKYFENTDPYKLPPIEVSFDGKNFFIEDGHHRYGYFKQLKLKTIPAVVDIKANPFKKLGFDIDDIAKYKKSLTTMNESIVNQIKNINDKTLSRSVFEGFSICFESKDLHRTDELDALLNNLGINPDDLNWLGSGDFGSAYQIENQNKVLKVTSSKSEFELAKQLVNHNYSSIAKIFAAEELQGSYYIVMEELDIDYDIENLYYQAEEALSSQGLDISQCGNFNEDEYNENYGEIDSDVNAFISELWGVFHDYNSIGVRAPDVKPDNLGRDSKGNLKAFDIDDKYH